MNSEGSKRISLYIELLKKWYNDQVESNRVKKYFYGGINCPLLNIPKNEYPDINHKLNSEDIFLVNYEPDSHLAIFETTYADGMYFQMESLADGIHMTPYRKCEKTYTLICGDKWMNLNEEGQ